jgi:hypothetical protein
MTALRLLDERTLGKVFSVESAGGDTALPQLTGMAPPVLSSLPKFAQFNYQKLIGKQFYV